MLSPHEMSTLLLIKSAYDSIDFDGTDLTSLLQMQLVTCEISVDGTRHLKLTTAGQCIARAIVSSALPASPRFPS